MSGTKYIASNWRVPENSNSSKNDNYSLSFDGGTEVLTWGQTDLPAAHTISFWIKMGGLSTDYRTILVDTTYAPSTPPVRRIYLRFGELIYIDTTSAGSQTFETTSDVGAILTDGDWHHVALVRNDTVGTIYIDNVDKTDDAAIGAQTAPYYLTRTGESITSYGSIFIGDLSDICFFDYALDAAQIESLAGRAETGAGNPMALKPTPVAYYPLGDNSASDPLTQPNVSVDDASVFDFDGSTQYINTGVSSLDGASAFTISTWVNSSYTDWMYLIGDNSFRIATKPSITRVDLTFNGSVDFRSTSFTLNAGQWHHVVVTFDGSLAQADRIKLYLDDVPISNTLSGTPDTTFVASGDFMIGRTGSYSLNEWNGYITQVATWNSVQNVTTLYNNGIPGDLTSLSPSAWYKLDQSANWDVGGSGNWQIPDAVSAYPQSFDFGDRTQSEYISLNQLPLYSAITVSAWIKTQKNNATNQTIISNNQPNNVPNERGWVLTIGEGWASGYTKGRFVFYDSTGTTATTVAQTSAQLLTDNKWHHVVAVWDGTTNTNAAKIFVDGILAGEQTSSFAGPINQPLAIFEPRIGIRGIGAGGGGGGNVFGGDAGEDGYISNVQTWDTNLSDGSPASIGDVAGGQIAELYNNGTPLTTAIQSDNLKGWWKLDNTATFSTNWTIPDASGNGNDGISSGMTEQNLVNNNVSTLNGESSGMTSGNLVLSDLTRNLPYENYSMEFDGTSDSVTTGHVESGDITLSAWINCDGTYLPAYNPRYPVSITPQHSDLPNATIGRLYKRGTQLEIALQLYDTTGSNFSTYAVRVQMEGAGWKHCVWTFNNTTKAIYFYLDGVAQTWTHNGGVITSEYLTAPGYTYNSALTMGNRYRGSWTAFYFEGKVSGVAVWNTALTPTEVLKLHANGMPQDLTNFTPQPTGWWTLGKESFWNGSNWIVRDMIGSNDGTSANMGVDSLVGDAPRSEANGTATNMDIPTNLVGNAGFSDNNAYSINMGPEARVTDTP